MKWTFDNATNDDHSYQCLGPNSTRRTRATDMLHNTTNGRAHNNSTTNLSHRNARAQHLNMSGCGKFLSVGGKFFVQQVVELLWLVSSSVGDVRSRCPCSGVWPQALGYQYENWLSDFLVACRWTVSRTQICACQTANRSRKHNSECMSTVYLTGFHTYNNAEFLIDVGLYSASLLRTNAYFTNSHTT